MTNEGLNKLLSIITENKGSKHHISKLSELALNPAVIISEIIARSLKPLVVEISID